MSAPTFERLPMNGALYRLLWAGQIATQLPNMATVRVRLWFAQIDESAPKQLKWARRPSGAVSVLAIEEAAGSVPKMVLGSFWRDRTQQTDYSMADEIVVKDACIEAQTWDFVYATDRIGKAGKPRIGPDEYPLMGEDARGGELRFHSAPLLRCYAASGLELLIPCYEAFRRFYALTSELANAILADSWQRELAKLVDLDHTQLAEDGESFEINPRVDIRDIGCLGIAYFMTMPHAARRVSEIFPALVNARRGGQREPWITAQPSWNERNEEDLKLSFVGRELSSGAVLVLWIYSSTFPPFPHSVTRVGKQLVVPIKNEDAPPRAPDRGLQVRMEELAEATIEHASDARLSHLAAHFELNETWSNLPRVTHSHRKRTYVRVNPETEGEQPPKRKRRLTTGRRAATGKLPTASLSSDAQNIILNRFRALAECFEDLLKEKDILQRHDWALVNPVEIGDFTYCAFPAKVGDVLRPWSFVNPKEPRPRLCWVSEITALDGSLYYWLEVETDAEAVRPEHFRALVVKPRMPGAHLNSETLQTILKIGVLEKAQWKAEAFNTLEEQVFWKSARHAFSGGRVTSSVVLGKLNELGAVTQKRPRKVKRRDQK